MKPLETQHSHSKEAPDSQMKYDAFISYSRKDRIIVLDFAEKLKSIGFKVWIDYEGIHSSDDFKSRIVEAINDSECFIFFSSVHSNNSQYTVKEVGVSVQLKKHIIPIKLDDALYAHSILFDLVNIDYVDATQHDIDYVFKKVTEVLSLYCGRQYDIPRREASLAYPKKKPKIQSWTYALLLVLSLVAFTGAAIALMKSPDTETLTVCDSSELIDNDSFPEENHAIIDNESAGIPTNKDILSPTQKKQNKSGTESLSEIEDYNRLIKQFYAKNMDNPSTRDLLDAQDIISQMLEIEKKHPDNPYFKQTSLLKKSLDVELEKKSNDYVQYAYNYCLQANNDSAAEDACMAARRLKYTEKVKQLERDIELRKNSQKKTQ